MKQRTIKDKTFKTHIRFAWDCSEEYFSKWGKKNFDFEPDITGAFGKTIFVREDDATNVVIWIEKKNNNVTLAHEILHAIRFWLQDYYNIALSEETEEIYTMLHSFYMGEILKIMTK